MKSFKWYATYLEIISLQKPKSHFSRSLRSLKNAQSEPRLLRKAQTWREMITHTLWCHVFFLSQSNAHSSVSHSNASVCSIQPVCFAHTRLAAQTNVESSKWKKEKENRPQWSCRKSQNNGRICTINDLDISFLKSENKHLGRTCTITCASSATVHLPLMSVGYEWINRKSLQSSI